MKEKRWKICMCGVLMHEGKILIVKRRDDDEEMGGFWEFPSGNAEEGVDLIKELNREIIEEVGIDISNQKLQILNLSQYNSEKKEYIKCSVQINYLINFETRPEINLSDEHVAYDWASQDDERLDIFLKDIIADI